MYCIVVEIIFFVVFYKIVVCYIFGFGMCWGWMYWGVDFVGLYGIDIFVIVDGVVIYVGWFLGYGKLIKI